MSIQLASKYSSNQPYHVYYNMDLINNNTATTALPANFVYNEVRNSPFLGSPENYFMSVVRFSVQTPTLPIFIPQILLGQADTNKTAYSVTLEWTATPTNNVYKSQTFVMYVPFDSTQTQPVAVGGGLSVTDLTNPYYWVYSYTQWVNMVNTAFSTAYAALQTSINGDGIAGDIAQWNALAGVVLPAQSLTAPFMEFNPTTLTATLNANSAVFSVLQTGATASVGSAVKIYFNSAMYSLYNSFQFKSFGYETPTFGRNFQVITFNLGTNLYSVAAFGSIPAYNAIQIYQENQTAAMLNPVTAIVFTTALIPIVPENVGEPRLFNKSGLTGTGGNSNVAPIITDFVVPFAALNTYRPDVTYVPSGEYRLCDLYGTTPLSGVEISVFWKDLYGQNHPLVLGSGCTANLKIMFRRKDYSTSRLFNSI